MAEYQLSPAAERDLEDIWQYTVDSWGVDQADDYVDTLAEAFEKLAEAPLSAPGCDHIRPGYRRKVVAHHLVFYRITNYGVAVIRVLHERMDASRHI